MIQVKMITQYKLAVAGASSREQRNGDVSIARDLRSIYVHTRARASEARELRLRAAALQAQAREEAEAALEHEEPLVTFEDAGDVLGMVEAPLLVPDGFKVVAASPTEGGAARPDQPGQRRAHRAAHHGPLRALRLVRGHGYGQGERRPAHD